MITWCFPTDPSPWSARFRFKVPAPTKVREGVKLWIDKENCIPTLAPVPAVRSATWDKLLTAEMDHTISAFTRVNRDLYFINKHSILDGGIIHRRVHTSVFSHLLRRTFGYARLHNVHHFGG